MRDLHPDFRQIIVGGYEIAPVILIFLDFAPMPVRVWNGVGTLKHDGHDWIGAGHIGGVEPIRESSEIKAESIQLILNALPDTELEALNEQQYKARTAEIYYCLLETSCNEVIACDLGWAGEMDTLSVRVSPQARDIELSIVNDLVRLKQTWGAMHTDSDQRDIDPDDTSHRFIHAIQDLALRV